MLAEPLAAASTSRPRASKTNANGNGPVAVVTAAEAGRQSGPSKCVHGVVVLRADQQLRAVVGDAYLSRRAPERGGVVPPRSSDRTEPGIAVNRSLALRRKPLIDPSSPALST